MIIRLRAGLALALSVYLISSTPSLYARGFKQRGIIVRQPGTFRDVTGTCSCNWKWYTVGLRPGKASFDLTVKSGQAIGNSTFDARVSIFQGGTTLAANFASCSRAEKTCDRSVHVTYPIKQTGVYYVLVQGEGAGGVHYSLHIRGSMYRLR